MSWFKSKRIDKLEKDLMEVSLDLRDKINALEEEKERVNRILNRHFGNEFREYRPTPNTVTLGPTAYQNLYGRRVQVLAGQYKGEYGKILRSPRTVGSLSEASGGANPTLIEGSEYLVVLEDFPEQIHLPRNQFKVHNLPLTDPEAVG